MKFKIVISTICLLIIFGCKKELKTTYVFADDTNKAYLKVINTVSNSFASSGSTLQAPVALYLNLTKLSGLSIGYGGVFPGLEFAAVQASATDYFSAKILASAATPQVEVISKNLNLEPGGIYSAFLVDTLPAVDIFLIKENLSAVADSGKYFVRFINLSTKSLGYDLYATTDAAIAFTNIAYKTASNFIQLNVGTGARSFGIRKTGLSANLATTSIIPVAGRMYTIFSYGVDGVTLGARSLRATFYTTRFQSPL